MKGQPVVPGSSDVKYDARDDKVRANYCTPEMTKVNFRWKMPLNKSSGIRRVSLSAISTTYISSLCLKQTTELHVQLNNH